MGQHAVITLPGSVSEAWPDSPRPPSLPRGPKSNRLCRMRQPSSAHPQAPPKLVPARELSAFLLSPPLLSRLSSAPRSPSFGRRDYYLPCSLSTANSNEG